MKSHGFLASLIDVKRIVDIRSKCDDFLLKEKNQSNYYTGDDLNIENLDQLINNCIYKKISILLQCDNPNLCSIELHVQLPGGSPIPPHQDNFYHCINPEKGLKILIPLQPMNSEEGALSFLNCDNKFDVLEHSPSLLENFSSYIKSSIVNKLNLTETTYSYEIGDSSYHFLNSIHFSNGNKTDKNIIFLVYRFQDPSASIDKEMLSKYEKCQKEHKLRL